MLLNTKSAMRAANRGNVGRKQLLKRQAHVASAVKIYTNPGSRGKIAEWTAAELGIDFEPVLLDMRAGDHKSEWFLKINPFGKVPAMQDGDVTLFESGAILLYLANKYGKLSPDALGTAAQWTLFANSTFCEAFFQGSKPQAQAAILETLDGILADKPYLAGKEFSVSDVAVGSYLLYLPLFFPNMPLTKYKHLWDYMKRIVSRPGVPSSYKEGMEAPMAAEQKSAGGAGGLLKKLGL